MFCLKPKIRKVPDGDWFCPVCQPTPRKLAKRRAVREVQPASDDDDDHDDDDDDSGEEEPTNARRSKRAKRSLVRRQHALVPAPTLTFACLQGKQVGHVQIESEDEDEEGEQSKLVHYTQLSHWCPICSHRSQATISHLKLYLNCGRGRFALGQRNEVAHRLNRDA